MKCYFDPEKEAHGQCQRCGRFANRYYSKIVEGKFICVACFYDNKPIYDIVVGLIEQGKSVEACWKCQRPVFYQWPRDDEYRMLSSTLTWDEWEQLKKSYNPDSSFFTSECPNGCYYCWDHLVERQYGMKKETEEGEIIIYDEHECCVCGTKWSSERSREKKRDPRIPRLDTSEPGGRD